MNTRNQQSLAVSRIQQRAKQLKSQRAMTDNQSLNLAALEFGFNDYQAYLDAVRQQAIQMMLYQNRQVRSQQSLN